MAVAEVPEGPEPGGIPAVPPYIPPSPGWFVTPPERGPEYHLLTRSWQLRRRFGQTTVRLDWSQYWSRVWADWLPCGTTPSGAYKVTCGVKQELTTELAGKLGIALGSGASVGISAAVRNRIERSHTREKEVRLPIRAPECARLLVTVWQVVDAFAVEQTRVLNAGIRSFTSAESWTYDIPTEVTSYNVAEWPDDSCCPKPHGGQQSPMSDFIVSFPSGQVGIRGEETDTGEVRLEGIESHFPIGGAVPLRALGGARPWLEVPAGADVTFGILTREESPGGVAVLVSSRELDRIETALEGVLEGVSEEALGELFYGSDRAVAMASRLTDEAFELDPSTRYSLLATIGARAAIKGLTELHEGPSTGGGYQMRGTVVEIGFDPAQLSDERGSGLARSPGGSGALALDIQRGQIEGVTIDGTKVVFIIEWLGAIEEGNGRGRLYVDEEVNDEQRIALERVLTGELGGAPFEILSSLLVEVLPTKRAPISFVRERGRLKVTIGGVGVGNFVETKELPWREDAGVLLEGISLGYATDSRFLDPEMHPWAGGDFAAKAEVQVAPLA